MEWLVATVAVTLPMVLVPVVGAALWCWWDDRRHKRECAALLADVMAENRRRWAAYRPGDTQEG